MVHCLYNSPFNGFTLPTHLSPHMARKVKRVNIQLSFIPLLSHLQRRPSTTHYRRATTAPAAARELVKPVLCEFTRVQRERERVRERVRERARERGRERARERERGRGRESERGWNFFAVARRCVRYVLLLAPGAGPQRAPVYTRCTYTAAITVGKISRGHYDNYPT